MCSFLVAEQERNQRSQLKGETRLRFAPLVFSLKDPSCLCRSEISEIKNRSIFGFALPASAGQRSEHLCLGRAASLLISGGEIFKRGRLVKSPLLNRFFSPFLAETRKGAPGGRCVIAGTSFNNKISRMHHQKRGHPYPKIYPHKPVEADNFSCG